MLISPSLYSSLKSIDPLIYMYAYMQYTRIDDVCPHNFTLVSFMLETIL